MPTNYKKIFNIIEKNKKKWLSVNPYLTDGSGIYILTRTDEHGIKYAYIGQSKHVLSRLADHLRGYSYIDLSLKKHGLKSKTNPYGYDVEQEFCREESLDFFEKVYIKEFADQGYQLRNNTIGGQGKGKDGLGERKSGKGYYDGVEYGYKKAYREFAEYLTKYFNLTLQRNAYKKDGTVKKLFINKEREFEEKMQNAKKEN